jgi:hypothetical protein
MKSPLLAFTLSFFIPGAGLWYLGKPGWGLVNLFVVLAIGAAAVLILPGEAFEKYIRWVAVVCAGGSGGLSQALSQQQNQAVKSRAGR